MPVEEEDRRARAADADAERDLAHIDLPELEPLEHTWMLPRELSIGVDHTP
jgi:hypothetical protein